jgi:RNA polymerase sigma-70 factor (ECF subfamily)
MSNRNEARQRERDARVVELVLAGERDLFRELVERYQDRVYTVALRLVANPDDAQDLTQLAFVDAFRALGRFDRDRSFYTWLMRIAVNKCKDHLKSHKRKEGHLTGDIPGSGALFSGRVAGPAETAEDRQRLELVAALLAEMDPKYSVPLLLKEVDEMSYLEISEVLGLPVTTLKIRVVRARQRLQEKMGWITQKKS